jgi:uncharacterized protein YkwD
MRRQKVVWVTVLLAGCAAPAATAGPIASGEAPAPAPALTTHVGTATPLAPPRPPASGLTRDEARRAMLRLINRDRASMGLSPVELDEGAATRAGQLHADDMASHGFLGHWGTDGSVPEQRYTEAGGDDMVLENASCFVDGRPRALDADARIDPKYVELAENMFFHEKPPNDGHRRNILQPWHRKVGIGIAQPVPTATEIPVPCFAQEFVDSFGTYGSAPKTMRVGDVLHVDGTLRSPALFAGVGLARVDSPRPLSVSELNARRSYPVPTPYEMLWPAGYQTPIPVRLSGPRFAVDVPVSDHDKPGMYELSVWASVPGSKEFVMVSLRTIQVRPR